MCCLMSVMHWNWWELASQAFIKSPENESISWKFVEELHKLQVSEGLRAGCKPQKRHIAWSKNKMKVGLAASTLSKRINDALDFCREDCKLPEFEGSAPTSKFLRTIDRAFDILNSRNVYAKGSKAAMSPNNKKEWEKNFSQTINYMAQLKNRERKTPCCFSSENRIHRIHPSNGDF